MLNKCSRYKVVIVIYLLLMLVFPSSTSAFFEGTMQEIEESLGWDQDPGWIRTTSSVPRVTTMVILLPPSALTGKGIIKMGFEDTGNAVFFGALGLSAGTYEVTAIPLRTVTGHEPVHFNTGSDTEIISPKYEHTKNRTMFPSPNTKN
ncbi:MAG: hypothetical protein ABEJ65_06350 [bacterium]